MSARRNALGGGAVALLLAVTAAVYSTSGDDASKATDTVTYEADYPAYRSLGEAVDEADAIVTGKVVRSRVEKSWPKVSTSGDPMTNPQAGLSEEEARQVEPVIVTVSTVRVSKVVSGNVGVGDTIEVSQLGGAIKETTYREVNTTTLAKDGTEYALLLSAHRDAPYGLINPEQGLYTVGPKGRIHAVSTEGLTGVDTVDDLRREVGKR
ncbi:hypothetical protein [Streptomyces sp. SAJ15]|uniref:hypothetical protein n=1 Tax=Streptomyces sp. SAJ15 TaxID=2011095 RepID=UPI001185BA7B|nr:hypothetical protein [Streptomyces sp. SAJ15]TVL93920.1 hypothetical protein CD790_02555 [Streptomyces sp. SAJ15]